MIKETVKKYWLSKAHEKTQWEKLAQVGSLPKQEETLPRLLNLPELRRRPTLKSSHQNAAQILQKFKSNLIPQQKNENMDSLDSFLKNQQKEKVLQKQQQEEVQIIREKEENIKNVENLFVNEKINQKLNKKPISLKIKDLNLNSIELNSQETQKTLPSSTRSKSQQKLEKNEIKYQKIYQQFDLDEKSQLVRQIESTTTLSLGNQIQDYEKDKNLNYFQNKSLKEQPFLNTKLNSEENSIILNLKRSTSQHSIFSMSEASSPMNAIRKNVVFDKKYNKSVYFQMDNKSTKVQFDKNEKFKEKENENLKIKLEISKIEYQKQDNKRSRKAINQSVFTFSRQSSKIQNNLVNQIFPSPLIQGCIRF